VPDHASEEFGEMGVNYYDALLPVREPGAGLSGMVAGIRLPYRVLVSVGVPAGRIVLAFVSDSARLSRMFAANWAPARTGQQPDATLCALGRPACSYGLSSQWDQARWWSPEHKMMLVFGCGTYRLAKVCVRGICSAVSGDDTVFVHGCTLSVGAGDGRRGVVITGSSGAGKRRWWQGCCGIAGTRWRCSTMTGARSRWLAGIRPAPGNRCCT
jgi:hypothetical protein